MPGFGLTSIIGYFAGKKPADEELKKKIRELEDQLSLYKDDEKLKVMASMLDHAPNSITVHDYNGRFLYANKKTFELHGYSESELMSLSLWELDVPESAALIEERMKIIIEKGEAAFEVSHYRKDRTIIPFEIYTSHVNWQGIPAIMSIATDISNRKQAEATIRQLSLAVEQTIEGISIADLNGKIIFANSAWGQMHGYQNEELIGKNLSIFHTAEQMNTDVFPFNQKVLQEGYYRAEVGHVKKDGTIFPTLMGTSLMKDTSGKPIAFIAVAMDITDRKKIEENLQESEEKFQKTFRHSPTLMAISTIDSGYFLDVNDCFLSTLEFTKDEVIGKTSDSLNLFADNNQRVKILEIFNTTGYA